MVKEIVIYILLLLVVSALITNIVEIANETNWKFSIISLLITAFVVKVIIDFIEPKGGRK